MRPAAMWKSACRWLLLVSAFFSAAAAAQTVTISGTTTSSGTTFDSVSFSATNGGTCTASNASGLYTCTVPQGWSGTITPAFTNFTFTPASRDYTSVAANTTAQNYDASSVSQISASPTAVAVGGTVTAIWSNVTLPSASNALYVYAVGGSWVASAATGSASASGSVPIVLPTNMQQGSYQVRLKNNGVLLAISNAFTVGPPVTISGTTTSSGTVFNNVTFTATNGGTCTTSSALGAYSCTVLQGWTGTITPSFPNFTLTPASRDYTNVTANTTAQTYDATSVSQVGASPTAIAVGGTVTATWSNVTLPSASNALYVYAVGGSWVTSRTADNAAASGSATMVLPTNMQQGSYQVRLFNSGHLLAISNAFTVGPPVTISGTTTSSGAVFNAVNFTATNGGTCTASNTAAQYSYTFLRGWTGTITPTFPNFTLTPASRDYTNVTANSTAQTYDATSVSQLGASPTAVAVGGTITAAWR